MTVYLCTECRQGFLTAASRLTHALATGHGKELPVAPAAVKPRARPRNALFEPKKRAARKLMSREEIARWMQRAYGGNANA
jgi:hypothetical protein